jgi:nickel and cobalt resistance protein CnrR
VKRFVLWALLAASLSANLAMAAVALRQRAAGPSTEPLLFSKVTLDPDQRARISELRSRLIATRDEHARNIGELRTRLAGAMSHQAENRAPIDAILGSIAESQAGFQRAVVEHVLAVRAVLRPEQRPAFEEIVADQMRAGGPMRCGFGGPAGQPADR